MYEWLCELPLRESRSPQGPDLYVRWQMNPEVSSFHITNRIFHIDANAYRPLSLSVFITTEILNDSISLHTTARNTNQPLSVEYPRVKQIKGPWFRTTGS